ncbi:hypothetical protein K438DRAFT_1818972 [Mycena galopus ATCC 62051]|nr:hypothetical protein K438DRAFT_1818972 [Mycena galopus ATCC 62051]
MTWLCSCHFLSAFPPFSDSSRACGAPIGNTVHEAGTLFHLTENLSIRRPKNCDFEKKSVTRVGVNCHCRTR